MLKKIGQKKKKKRKRIKVLEQKKSIHKYTIGGYIWKRRGREAHSRLERCEKEKKYKKIKRTKGGQEVNIGEHSRKSPKSISYPLKTQRWSFFFSFFFFFLSPFNRSRLPRWPVKHDSTIFLQPPLLPLLLHLNKTIHILSFFLSFSLSSFFYLSIYLSISLEYIILCLSL